MALYEDFYSVLHDDFLFSRYANNIDFIYSNYWALEVNLSKYVDAEDIEHTPKLSDKDLLVLALYLYKANKTNINGYSIKRLHYYNCLIKLQDEEIWERRFSNTPFLYVVNDYGKSNAVKLLTNQHNTAIVTENVTESLQNSIYTYPNYMFNGEPLENEYIQHKFINSK